MARICVPDPYLVYSGIPGLHQPPFGKGYKASWLQPSFYPGNPSPAKLLRTIIGALNLTILHYPDKDVLVWAHDANESLSNCTALVVIALLFLFLPYTLLLLLGQWLQAKSHLHLLSSVNNP